MYINVYGVLILGGFIIVHRFTVSPFGRFFLGLWGPNAGPWGPGRWDGKKVRPSGYVKIAIENGPFIVDLP